MSPTKYVILVKHSLPEILEDVPAREWHLSDTGRALAGKLAGELMKWQPEIVVASVEPKARETAEVIARDLGLKFHEVDGLHEHDRSRSPYYSKFEFQNLVREFFEKPSELIFGNETANVTLERFQRAVDVVLNSSSDKNTIIVAHGTVISLYASWLTGLDGYDLWQKLGLPSFVVLDIQSKTLHEIVNLT
ncbi:MAG: histidine phosphatase family protein [Chloroflexota bacterium]